MHNVTSYWVLDTRSTHAPTHTHAQRHTQWKWSIQYVSPIRQWHSWPILTLHTLTVCSGAHTVHTYSSLISLRGPHSYHTMYMKHCKGIQQHTFLLTTSLYEPATLMELKMEYSICAARSSRSLSETLPSENSAALCFKASANEEWQCSQTCGPVQTCVQQWCKQWYSLGRWCTPAQSLSVFNVMLHTSQSSSGIQLLGRNDCLYPTKPVTRETLH